MNRANCVFLRVLAAAYSLDGNERYARKAVQLLDVFFVEGGKRMNPHLLYAQAISGRSKGRGIVWQTQTQESDHDRTNRNCSVTDGTFKRMCSNGADS